MIVYMFTSQWVSIKFLRGKRKQANQLFTGLLCVLHCLTAYGQTNLTVEQAEAS